MKSFRILVIALSAWLVAMLVSGLLSMLEATQERDSRSALALNEYQTPDLSQWKLVFSAIAKFNPEPVKSEDTLVDMETAPQLSDAVLVGTVLTAQPKALLLLPGKDSAEELAIGELWLAPWVLKRIEQNRIFWQNQDTNQQQQQVLFQ